MIKLGCNSLVCDRDGPDEWIDVEVMIGLIHALRLDVIDFQIDRGFRSRDPEYLRRIEFMCHERGLPIGFVGVGHGFVGVENTGQGRVGAPLTPEEMRSRVEEVMRGVDDAVVLGAPLIRLFAGAIPEGTKNHETLKSAMIASFQEVADYANDVGVLIGLHNHPPAVAPTGQNILQLLKDIDRENVTHILDTGQWWGSPGTNREGKSIPGVDIYEYMEQTAPYATYVRAKIYKIDSGREEWLDYERVIPILKRVNYNGIVSIVFEDRGNDCDYAKSIRLAATYLRRLIDETQWAES